MSVPYSERSEQWRAVSARRLQERMRLRTALHEGVGILRVWHICGQEHARDQLDVAEGRDVEAARVIAAVNAAAEDRADPDATWG
jgi:hypothetical protein